MLLQTDALELLKAEHEKLSAQLQQLEKDSQVGYMRAHIQRRHMMCSLLCT